MESLRYEAPKSIANAIALLESPPDEGARVLAGGTDLLVQLRAGVLEPGLIVDVKHIPELMQVRLDADGCRIGAAVPAAELRETPGLREQYPGEDTANGVLATSRSPTISSTWSFFPYAYLGASLVERPVDSEPFTFDFRVIDGSSAYCQTTFRFRPMFV